MEATANAGAGGNTQEAARKAKPKLFSAGLVFLLILLTLGLMTAFTWNGKHLGVWLSALAGMFVCLAAAGYSVTGRFFGVLIDTRNLISLSRFQFASWTLLLLSAFFAAAWIRILDGAADALAVALDPRLWVLMGISTTALVGSPVILSDRKTQSTDANALDSVKKLSQDAGTAPEQVQAQGALYANATPDAAAWSDLVTGEELKNALHVDLSRLQMLFFTVVVLIAYAADLVRFFSTGPLTGNALNLPALHESMVALIGISHGGYLAAKAASKT